MGVGIGKWAAGVYMGPAKRTLSCSGWGRMIRSSANHTHSRQPLRRNLRNRGCKWGARRRFV